MLSSVIIQTCSSFYWSTYLHVVPKPIQLLRGFPSGKLSLQSNQLRVNDTRRIFWACVTGDKGKGEGMLHVIVNKKISTPETSSQKVSLFMKPSTTSFSLKARVHDDTIYLYNTNDVIMHSC